MRTCRSPIVAAILAGVLLVGLNQPVPASPEKLQEHQGPTDLRRESIAKEAREAEDKQDYQRAIELYSQAIGDAATSSFERRELLRGRAFAYEDAKQYGPAEADWGSALNVLPVKPNLYVERGLFYIRQKRFEEALADFKSGAELDPGKSIYAYGEGRAYEKRGDYQLAIERYSEAIRRAPEDGFYWSARGSAYNYLKMYEQALADYERALALGGMTSRQRGMAHLGRGWALNQLDRFDRAVKDFDKVLEIVPRASNALKWRGFAHDRLGNNEQAIADYKAALTMAPDDWVTERLKTMQSK
jgi:tetratricopeptide (TPR) repeat protein